MASPRRSLYFYIIIVIVLAVVGFYISKGIKAKQTGNRQAVFLTNGQVYFGKLSKQTDKFTELKDVYYFKQDESLQSGVDLSTKKISLLKLGGELHGPEDTMYINRDHILFYENMKDASKINDAIKRYLESGPTSSTPSTSPSSSPSVTTQ